MIWIRGWDWGSCGEWDKPALGSLAWDDGVFVLEWWLDEYESAVSGGICHLVSGWSVRDSWSVVVQARYCHRLTMSNIA